MPYLPVAPEEWAQQQFDECELGDRRRNKTLVKIGAHMAARPDGSTPVQTENWATCKAAYRLFNEPDVTFGNITRPHYRRTRAQSDGPVKLLISDTTELDFGIHRQIEGLAPTGNGGGWGFYVHSCLMVDPVTGVVDGLA
ncbi:MAG: transposase, partial [Planctomycetaceae bacterium]